MLRPTFLDHEDDPLCHADTDDFLLGRDLLVANVVDKGAALRRVYLPRNTTGWWDFHLGRWFSGGQWLDLPVTLESIPLFVRAGAVLPLASGALRATPKAETARVLALFPAPMDSTERSYIYDDSGDNADALSGNHCLSTVTLARDQGRLALEIAHQGDKPFPFREVTVELPRGLKDRVTFAGRVLSHRDLIVLEGGR